MRLGSNVSGHKRVWEQRVGTNVCGHKRVWTQTCLDTNVCGRSHVVTVVWAQTCVEPTNMLKYSLKTRIMI